MNIKIKNITVVLLFTALFISISFVPLINGANFYNTSVDLGNEKVEVKEWTSLYYINVESNQPWWNFLFSADILHDKFIHNGQLKSGENHNVLVLQDKRRDPAEIYYMDGECNSILLEEIGEVNVGDSQTLIDFIQYAKQQYPAERYQLAFWSHSNAWFEICTDVSNNKDKLTPEELHFALEETGGVDLLSFIGCCLMGSLEAAYEVKDDCEVYVASESTGNGNDWYGMIDDLCDILNNKTTINTIEIGEEIVRLICHNPNEFRNTMTISAIRTDKMEKLKDSIEELSNFLIDNDESCYQNFLAARNLTKDFFFVNNSNFLSPYIYGYSYLLDIYDFVEKYLEIEIDVTIQQLLKNIKNNLSETIISECHGINQTGSHGLSIFYSTNDMLSTYANYNLDFTRDTHWDDFLRNHKEKATSSNGVNKFIQSYLNYFNFGL